MLNLLVITFFGLVLKTALIRADCDITYPPDCFRTLPTPFSESEKSALISLRNLAGPELVNDYMKEDNYLVRWLLKTNLDVPEALELLRENLHWRDQLNVSTILQEDWRDMHAKFPYTRDTVDVEGRPILYFDIGQYDLANFLSEEGSDERFLRYFVKIHEESQHQLRQIRSRGKDVHQYVIIFNLGDFSIMRQGCVQCLQVARVINRTLKDNYPMASAKTMFVNTPTIMKAAYSVLFTNRSSLIVYGQDRHQWRSMLKEFIHPDQFPAGLKEDKEPEQKDNSDGLLHWSDEL